MNSSVPGVVIHHISASTEKYVGCPSIAQFPDGEFIATHSHFGPGAANTNTYVYSSQDGGKTWVFIAKITGQIWSNLFLHQGDLYVFGTDHCDSYGGRFNGRIVIRRSRDRGHTWSEPANENVGLLTDEVGWHTAPCPVVTHRGRIWRAFEFAPELDRSTWRTVVLSAPEDSDLLDRSSWTFSEQLEHLWSESQWIEGNVVVTPDGEIANILRCNYRGDDDHLRESGKDKAAIVHVSETGERLRHDPDLIDFPGGGTKFTIRYDSKSGRYWSLVNKQKRPAAMRNRLYLTSSADLHTWRVERLLLQSDNAEFHAFQYVDWIYDGEDIAYVSRTAYDDGKGGAHSFHDANFLTFHRIMNLENLNSWQEIGESNVG